MEQKSLTIADFHGHRLSFCKYLMFLFCVLREGTLRAGDRVLSIDGMPLHREKHADALTVLMQSSQEALFLIEYDVSVHGELLKLTC